jgi:hypothetical protein
MLTRFNWCIYVAPLRRCATCCIDTSESRSGSAESAVPSSTLAASKHKRSRCSDETKRKNCEEKTCHSPWESTRPRLLAINRV